jgi:hypothetical protein
MTNDKYDVDGEEKAISYLNFYPIAIVLKNISEKYNRMRRWKLEGSVEYGNIAIALILVEKGHEHENGYENWLKCVLKVFTMSNFTFNNDKIFWKFIPEAKFKFKQFLHCEYSKNFLLVLN